eukprot:TRINITY_DN15040_c0_g1_i5.p1 TRINITY_DN15040_c0_g1~~TRINITY_DN15040_c0_g1_i5.p1  ORF type:complete len:138 (-),score=32.45 TRINITY_DN15040_c0_g1_i5:78-491(-)
MCIRDSINAEYMGTNAGAQVLLKFSQDISSFLGIEKSLDDYKTVIKKAVTDNGITVQLNEVILDDNELIISTNITSDKVLNENETYDTEKDIYINGKKVKFIGESGGAQKVDDYTTCLLYTSPSPRDLSTSRMPSSA